MTTATRALWSLHRGRRLLVLAVVAAAVGLIALSGARPARAGGGPPDVRPDTLTDTYLPANRFMGNPAGWYLVVNVRNIGGSDVNQPFRVAVILGGAVEMNETYT